MYKSGAHTKHRLRYHIVWIPKYRKRLLTGRVAQRLKELLQQCAESHDWVIEEQCIQVDHIHLLIQLNPSESVSYAVHILKGGTSRVIRQEFPTIKEQLWGASFWADGYFAETFGQCNEELIKAYVRNQ